MTSFKSRHLAASLVALLTIPGLAKDFEVAPPADPFRDVTEEHWAFEAVNWLRKKGLLEGWGTRFHGRRNFSRYEMAEILARFTQKLERARDRYEADGGAPSGDLRTRLRKIRSRFSPKGSTGDIAALRADLHRVASLVATHQVLLERPSSQANWRQNMGKAATRGGGAEPGRTLELAAKVPDPARDQLMAELDELTAEEMRQARLVEDGRANGQAPRARIQDALARLRVDKYTLAAARHADRRQGLAETIQLSKSLRTAKGSGAFGMSGDSSEPAMASLDDAPALTQAPPPKTPLTPEVTTPAAPATAPVLDTPRPVRSLPRTETVAGFAVRPLPSGVIRKDGRPRRQKTLSSRRSTAPKLRPAPIETAIPPGAMIGPSLIEARSALPSARPTALPAAAVTRSLPSLAPSEPLSTRTIPKTPATKLAPARPRSAPQRMTLETGPNGTRLTPTSGTKTATIPAPQRTRSHPRLLKNRIGANRNVPPPPVPVRPQQDAIRQAHEAKLAKARAAAKAAQARVAVLERNRNARRHRDTEAEKRAEVLRQTRQVSPAAPIRRPAAPVRPVTAPAPRSVLAMAPRSVPVPGGTQAPVLRRARQRSSAIRTAPLVAKSAYVPRRRTPVAPAQRPSAAVRVHSMNAVPTTRPRSYPVRASMAPAPVTPTPQRMQPRRLANPLGIDPVRSPALAKAQAQVPVSMSAARSHARAILEAVDARRKAGLPVVARPLPKGHKAAPAARDLRPKFKAGPNFRPGLILPGNDTTSPAPTYGQEPDQQRRLLAALADVRAGKVSRQQAEVIVRLASLAFQSSQSEWF